MMKRDGGLIWPIINSKTHLLIEAVNRESTHRLVSRPENGLSDEI